VILPLVDFFTASDKLWTAAELRGVTDIDGSVSNIVLS